MEIGNQFKTVALVGRSNTPGIGEPLTVLATCIGKRGFEVVFEAETAREIVGWLMFSRRAASLAVNVRPRSSRRNASACSEWSMNSWRIAQE